MATPGVGEDIEDVCARCGESWHVVMAKMADRIAKVVCKRCGSQHGYRGDNAAPQAAAPNGGAAAPFGRRVNRRRRKPEAAAPVTPDFDPNQPPRAYSARDTYQAGERIQHPTFGTGVVAGAPVPGRIDVVFPAGARALACAKAEATLERPVAVSGVPIADRPPDKE